MSKEYKLYEKGNLYDKFKQCFNDGYRPITFDELMEYQNTNNVSSYVANAVINGINVTIRSMHDVERVKSESGRFWWVGSLGYYYGIAGGGGSLYFDGGRLVGVREKQSKRWGQNEQ